MGAISMIIYKWDFLELFGNADKLISVRYKLSGKDKDIIVESEGNHVFSDGTANKALSEIVESDIFQWIEKDTTIDGINPIKLGIENQIKQIESNKKVDFPWLAGTFTIE
jgi:hypothetical protein